MTTGRAVDDRDAKVGAAVVLLRGSLSQQRLADRMRERGWKWSQATVWTVESGVRPLRLAEAADLAEILDSPIGDILEADLELAAAEREVEKARVALIAAAARHQLAETALIHLRQDRTAERP